MAMDADDIERLIKAGHPDAEVEIEDLAGDGDHYAATVVSEQLSRQDRACSSTRWSMRALRGRMGGELHALALQTSTPDN